MAIIDGGATLWARQSVDSAIFFNKPDKWFKIWFYMVMKAQWRDKRGLRRGLCHLKYEWIMDATGAKRDEVSNCIRWLKRTTQITTQKTTRGFILTICNYDKFQDLRNYINDNENDNENDTGTTQERHRNDTILKKGNKEKKEKKRTYTSDFESFWKEYPNKTGKKPSWEKWVKSNNDRPPIEMLLKAIEKQKQSDKWKRGFIPNPLTWLNEARWEDEPVQGEKSKPELKARNFRQEYNVQSAKAFLERGEP